MRLNQIEFENDVEEDAKREEMYLPNVRTVRRIKTPTAFMADAELISTFSISQSLIDYTVENLERSVSGYSFVEEEDELNITGLHRIIYIGPLSPDAYPQISLHLINVF